MFDPALERGLSSREVAAQRARHGANELPSRRQRTLLAIVAGVAREPMFLMLVAAGALYLALGDLGEALMLLGRHPEAAEAFRQSLASLRRMSPRDLGAAEYRRLWIQQSDRLFQALIGMDRVAVLRRFLDGQPARFEVAAGDVQMNTVLLDIDESSGRARSIQRLNFRLD